MIKTRLGTTEFKGSHAEIMADYVSITSSMFDYLMDKEEKAEDEAIEYLKEAFEMGIDNKKTMDKAMEKLDGLVSDFLADILAKTIKKLEEDDEPEECDPADDEDDEEDDEPEIECDAKVIEVKSPEELLEALNGIVSTAKKKAGEE